MQEAILKGDLQYLRSVDRHQLTQPLDKWGNGALHFAAEHNKTEVVKQLLDLGIPINVTSPVGYTPLHNAAVSGSLEVLTYLLERKADVYARTVKHNQLPIHKAAQEGHLSCVKALIAFDSNLAGVKGCEKEGKTLLILAVESRKLAFVAYLVEEVECPINEVSHMGNTALHYAAVQFQDIEDDLGVVHSIWRYLINHGAYCFTKPNVRRHQFAIEKLPWSGTLMQMLETAFSLNLDPTTISVSPANSLREFSFLFDSNAPLSEKMEMINNFLEEMQEVRPDDWSDAQLAFREFLFLYPKYCKWRRTGSEQ